MIIFIPSVLRRMARSPAEFAFPRISHAPAPPPSLPKQPNLHKISPPRRCDRDRGQHTRHYGVVTYPVTTYHLLTYCSP